MIKLDSHDLKILEILRRLEETGVITGYTVQLDPKKLVSATTIMVDIILHQHHSTDFKRFENAIQNVSEIVECHATGGGLDYVMKVITRDVDSYQLLMDRLLQDNIGIDRYFSYIVTKPSR